MPSLNWIQYRPNKEMQLNLDRVEHHRAADLDPMFGASAATAVGAG